MNNRETFREAAGMLTREDQTSLVWLQWNWEDYYEITLEDGTWRAASLLAPDDVLTADNPYGLRDEIHAHHARVTQAARQ